MKYFTLSCCLFMLVSCGEDDQTQILNGNQSNVTTSNLLESSYNGFKLWMDCDKRSAVRFEYFANEDKANYNRHSSFYFDPYVSRDCQQTSTASYKTPTGSTKYDRGHLVPANHMDSSTIAIKESNYITNILPQAANMNRGAWLKTEEIIECYRDIEPLYITGGALYLENMADTFEPHELTIIPSHFWKIIQREDDVISWLIPNNNDAKRGVLDEYLVSVNTLERVTGFTFDIPRGLKNTALTRSWENPKGCDKS